MFFPCFVCRLFGYFSFVPMRKESLVSVKIVIFEDIINFFISLKAENLPILQDLLDIESGVLGTWLGKHRITVDSTK